MAGLVCGAVAALSLAGCVSMPDGGAPSSLPVNQSDAGQSQDYVGANPAGPESDWDPQQIVQGFLFASASYYTASGTVRSYLTPQASKTWLPGGSGSVAVFSQKWNASNPVISGTGSGQQARITVTGEVQANLSSTGQSSAVQGSGADGQSSASAGTPCQQPGGRATCNFTLVRSGGMWRISEVPHGLLLDANDFDQAWKPQDLYFFDPSQKVLVPDSIFVPIGTSETDLLKRLAQALQGGPPPWLSGDTSNVFELLGHGIQVAVTVDGPVAIVNLSGSINPTAPAERQALGLFSAELVWTLTSESVNQLTVQSVQLDVNGKPLGTPQSLETYNSYDPYPAQPANFTYVDENRVAQWQCGSTGASIGSPVPVFGRKIPECSATAPVANQSTPSGKPSHSGKAGKQQSNANPYSMVAVSPSGKQVAVVSLEGLVSVGSLSKGQAALTPVPGLGLGTTAISWDWRGNLWVAQGGDIWYVPPGEKPIEVSFPGNVTALSVAPDGVRFAVIVQGKTGSMVELAAVNLNGDASGKSAPHTTVPPTPTFGKAVPLGPGITGAVALSWYNADTLIVGTSTSLQEVPVDGRGATPLPSTPSLQAQRGATITSIAAGSFSNVLVVGLSNGQLLYSMGFDDSWQNAGRGYAPSYQIPSASG